MTGLKKNELVEKWKEVLQSGENAPVMEGWSVEEEELNKLTTEPVTMGDTALARHQSLIERQMGNIIKNMSKEKRDELKQKLEEADDSPDHLHTLHLSYLLPKFLRHRTNPKEKETM
mgnify:CR=1 FL=1